MDKSGLLSLLDDVDVRQKILSIMNQDTDDTQEKLPEATDDNGQQRADNLQAERDYWQKKFDAEHQRADKLQIDVKAWIKQFENQQRRVEELQGKLDTFVNKLNDEHERADRLQDKFKDAQDKLDRMDEIVRGWEVFQKYQDLGFHARQLLKGVFTRNNDFMSFICGGAQTDSLETIWDVLRECVMSGKNQDAEILTEVFKYCLELVNASKVQASYSILPVKVGDRFDIDVHNEAPGSRAQGKITAVYLQGYRNDYNRRIIRKSIVQVS